jgi:hypothetical protein
MYFLNNCVGRNYISIYGVADAFYDLGLTGSQAKKATALQPGDTCVVATTIDDGQIRFTKFRFRRVEVRPDEDGVPERVFCGPPVSVDTLHKVDAARHHLYSVFFDKNGNFKRQSVLER